MTPLLQQKLWEQQTPAERQAAHVARQKRLGTLSEPPRFTVKPKEPKPKPKPKPELVVAPQPVSSPPPALRYSFRLAERILEEVAKDHGFSVEYVRSKARNVKVTKARHLAIHLIAERVDWGTTQLGHFFFRDHTTVMHACRKIARQLDIDPSLREELSHLNDLIGEIA